MAKKAAPKTQRLRKVKITPDLKVELTFVEKATTNTVNDKGVEGFIENEYILKSKYVPTEDLINSLRVLRKHGLAILELDSEAKKFANYTVNELQIQGSIEEKTAQCTMVLQKKLKRHKKLAAIPVPQVPLFDKDLYHDGADLLKLIEIVVTEVWAYLGGKHLGEEQLSLFSKD